MKAAEKLLIDAMALPDDDRAELAARLLESLPQPPGLSEGDASYADELRRRVDRALEHPEESVSVEQVFVELDVELSQRHDA